jgi:hypothetical protein
MQKEKVFAKKNGAGALLRCTMLSLASLLIVSSLSSCTPQVDVPPATPNALLSAPDTLSLPKPLDTIYSTMHLECGCSFAFTMTAAGDTSKIKWVIPASSTSINQYGIGAYAINSLPSGSYSSWISFQTHNDDPTGPPYFYDTVHASIVIP